MNLFFRIAEKWLPVCIKKRELKKLFHISASAFGSDIPSMIGLSYNECLAEYARFTKTAVEQSTIRGENIQIIYDRLFQQAYEYGSTWRKRFGISNMHEVMKAGKILYRAIGIDFDGADQGAIKIGRCFFSQYYSPATCKVVSFLDAGIMAGLSGGAILSFSQRITEGFDFCRAQLWSEEFVA